MQITSFGHSCLLIEESGARILIDPGGFSRGFESLTQLDAILLTHEHTDHTEPTRVTELLRVNPAAVVRANAGAGAILTKASVSFELVRHGDAREICSVRVRAIGEHHAQIYHTIPVVPNTGYMIAERFFHPGDALTDPGQPVEILALPVVAPWSKVSDVLDYALRLKPKVAFLIHDAFLQPINPYHKWAKTILEPAGIDVVIPEHGKLYTW